MEIEVWSVGKTKFTADPEFQEPVIREVIDQRGDVADVIIDYTDSERSDISHDEYARVTGDVPGLVLFEGWLTGDRNTAPPASAAAQEPQASPELTASARHVMRLTRKPGHDAELTIDGIPVRIVNLKVTPDVMTVVYE
jgi:hypothetical protein